MENTAARIFIVEDSRTQADRLQATLEAHQFVVEAAASGAEALERIPDFDPQIVITDIVMPEMDGYELCRRLKDDPRTKLTPVILLTSLSEPEDVLHGLSCGADQFLTKPWEEEFLISRIKFILANLDIRKRGTISDLGMEIVFAGKRFRIDSDRMQILDLLLSTYENAVQKARELERTNQKLMDAFETINTMKDLVPICSVCRKIRDDSGYWDQIESFLAKHNITKFSHGYCPNCARKVLEEAGIDPAEADGPG